MAAGDDGKPPHLCSTEWPTALVATSTAGKPFTCFYRDQSRLVTAHSDSDEMDGESDRQQYGILTIESTGRQVFHRWNADDGKLELLQTAIADDNDGDGPIADALLCTGADMISTVSVGRQTASLSIKQQRVDLILASAVADRQQHQEDFSFPVTHRHEPSVLTDAFNMTKMTLAASGKSTDPFVLSSSGNSIQPNSTSTANCRRTQMSSQSTYSPATSLLPAKAAAVSTRSLAIIPEATGNIKLGLDLDHFVTSATALSVNFDDSGDRGFKFDDDRPPVKSAAESIPQTFQRIIKGRLEAMKAIQERWTDSNINDCLELLCRSLRDPAVLVDLLRVINKRPRMFTLDSCVLLFQTIPELLFDNSAAHLLFEEYVCVC
jgi:hypothetical protein